MKSNLPPRESLLGKATPGTPSYVLREYLGSGCNALVFRAHCEGMSRTAACKVIPYSNLVNGPEDSEKWMREVRAANVVSSSRVVKFFDVGIWPEIGCVYLLSDLIEGVNLRDFLKKARTLDMDFVLNFFITMLDFLRELDDAHTKHGDLHSGNIIVEDRAKSFIGKKFDYRVTDFGVASLSPDAELLDDWQQLGRLMREMLEKVDYQRCEANDRAMYMLLRDDILGKRMLERDQTFGLSETTPHALFALLESTKNSATRLSSAHAPKLTTPFEFTSCEQMGEAHTLIRGLYSNKLFGHNNVEGRTNVVLTGPRGCGKTTVFRSMSLEHRCLTDSDLPDDINFIGIYYQCLDLQFAFPRYELPSRKEAFNLPMHYIISTLARGILVSLSFWGHRRFHATLFDQEVAAARRIWSLLSIPKPRLPNADSFSALASVFENERRRAKEKQRFAEDPKQDFGAYFGPEVFLSICEALQKELRCLEGRPFYCFIDDYSKPGITRDLQRNLNRLLMVRTPLCFFKLATDSPASYEIQDIDGRTYVEGREFQLTNLGIEFISAGPKEKLNFIEDIFDRRLSHTADFPIKRFAKLVGGGEKRSNDDVARLIREGKPPKTWGKNAIVELCSGDIHFLLKLVGQMVVGAGGVETLREINSIPAIPLEVQNRAIRTGAGDYVKSLRSLTNGERLVDIVSAFGRVAGSYLKGRDSKVVRGKPVPHQAARIDLLDDPRLSEELREVYDELLRYSVFLEDVRGKSRRGSAVPRLHLRRFLIPFFNLTFSRGDSIELSIDDFQLLLTDPKKFEGVKTWSSSADAEARNQLDLLDRTTESREDNGR